MTWPVKGVIILAEIKVIHVDKQGPRVTKANIKIHTLKVFDIFASEPWSNE